MLATPDMDTEGKWSHLSSNERDLILEESGEMALCCVIVTNAASEPRGYWDCLIAATVSPPAHILTCIISFSRHHYTSYLQLWHATIFNKKTSPQISQKVKKIYAASRKRIFRTHFYAKTLSFTIIISFAGQALSFGLKQSYFLWSTSM